MVAERIADLTTPTFQTAEIIEVTPDIAERWLSANTNNRAVMRRAVQQYAQDIVAGRWHLNGEAIKLSVSGRVLDGQHRLLAVVTAGQPIRSWVVRGVPDDAMPTLDTGRRRRASDALTILGYPNARSLAAIAAVLIRYERNARIDKPRGRESTTSGEILDFIDAHPRLVDSALAADSRSRQIPGLPASIHGALHYLFSGVDAEACDTFFDALLTGASLPPGSPILLLRNRLHDNAVSSRKMQPYDVAAITVKAWNAWREGRSLKQLSYRSSGDAAEKFPEIK